MARKPTPAARVLTWFAVSLVGLVMAALGIAALSAGGVAVAVAIVAPACVFVGLGWVILGWILSPSVETYVGPGVMRGMPLIGPSFANPERSPPVLEDLAWKLSHQTSLGILSASMGFGLMLVGFAFYLAPVAGYGAGLAYVAVMAAVLASALRPARPAAPR